MVLELFEGPVGEILRADHYLAASFLVPVSMYDPTAGSGMSETAPLPARKSLRSPQTYP